MPGGRHLAEAVAVRAGADGVGSGGGDVRDEQRALHCSWCSGYGQTTAFDGGEVLAEGVDLRDGKAGSDQDAVEGDEVVEGDAGVEWQIKHSGGSATDEEEDSSARGGLGEEIKDSVGCRYRGRREAGVGAEEVARLGG